METSLAPSPAANLRRSINEGIAVLPCSALTPKHQNKRLVSLKFAEPVPKRTIGLAWRKGFSRPLALQALIEAVQKVKITDLEMCESRP
jgi:LysR family hydrogen peroxide-inducible transcriptional activator